MCSLLKPGGRNRGKRVLGESLSEALSLSGECSAKEVFIHIMAGGLQPQGGVHDRKT